MLRSCTFRWPTRPCRKNSLPLCECECLSQKIGRPTNVESSNLPAASLPAPCTNKLQLTCSNSKNLLPCHLFQFLFIQSFPHGTAQGSSATNVSSFCTWHDVGFRFLGLRVSRNSGRGCNLIDSPHKAFCYTILYHIPCTIYDKPSAPYLKLSTICHMLLVTYYVLKPKIVYNRPSAICCIL